MKLQHQHNTTFSEDRFQAARAALNSAIADAAAHGTITEAASNHLTKLAADTPRDRIDQEIFTERSERLSQAMSYFNNLYGAGRLEAEMVRMVFDFGTENPDLICAVVDATKRDISLIEYRLDAAVQAGTIDEATKSQILAKPFLNQQADDALEVFSKIARKPG